MQTTFFHTVDRRIADSLACR